MTYAERLAQVRAAITAILERGQAYTIKDRQFTRAQIRELWQMEKELIPLAEREARGGGVGIRFGTPT